MSQVSEKFKISQNYEKFENVSSLEISENSEISEKIKIAKILRIAKMPKKNLRNSKIAKIRETSAFPKNLKLSIFPKPAKNLKTQGCPTFPNYRHF